SFPTCGNERLSRSNRPCLNHRSTVSLALIGQKWILVHGPADAVAAKTINDEKFYIPLFFGGIGCHLNRVRYVRQTITRLHSLDALLQDPRGGIGKTLRIRSTLPDAEGPRRVPHPSIESGTTVNRD